MVRPFDPNPPTAALLRLNSADPGRAGAPPQGPQTPSGWRSAEAGGLDPPGRMCACKRAAGPLCGLLVGKDAKARWAAAGHGRDSASRCGSERRFDLGDDGEKGGRGGFEVIAAVAHVGEEPLNIEDPGALRIDAFPAPLVSLARDIGARIERGKYPCSGQRHARVDEDASERPQRNRSGER